MAQKGYKLTKTAEEMERLLDNLTAADGTEFRFGITEDGKYGYIVTNESTGEDEVRPF